MPKSYKIFLTLLIVLLGVLIYIESSRPDPVDWTPTYSTLHKRPMGTYVFYESLKTETDSLHLVNSPPFEFLKGPHHKGTYVFIQDYLNFNEAEMERILDWVSHGDQLFISANQTNFFTQDTLHLKQVYKSKRKSLINYPEFNLSNKKFHSERPYVFKHNSEISFFEKLDTLNQKVLGTVNLQSDSTELLKDEVNFIKVPHGEGSIVLHTSPQVFSNFFLLSEDNYEYTEKALAYLNNDQPIYYDVYSDWYYNLENQKQYSSPLYVLLNNKYLKWGYYFIVIGGILFIIFEGKRKQKAIPVIPPLRNQTYDYTRTISGMYLDEKNHTHITHKKIQQFFDFIRDKFRLDISGLNQNEIHRLAQLTDNSEEDLQKLLELIGKLNKTDNISKSELLNLNKQINNFKENI